MRYSRIIRLVLAAIVVISVSSCGIFRKGCKCPPVHRQQVVPTTHAMPSLQGFGHGNRTHLGGSVLQQGAGASFEGGAGRQHIIYQ